MKKTARIEKDIMQIATRYMPDLYSEIREALLDAARFRFIEKTRIKCGIRKNGMWEAHGRVWVSRKTLRECIDTLISMERDPEHDPLPKIGFLRLPDVLRLFPVSKSSWWRGVKAGIYPLPVKLSPNVSAWRVRDIHALIERVEAEGATR